MRHGIDLKPIHNVKDAGRSPLADRMPGRISCFHLWSVLLPYRASLRSGLVEPIGIEPMTSSLQS